MIPVALRTLEMCSHDTSMDCPYYERLNYVGDTRLQSLVAYAALEIQFALTQGGETLPQVVMGLAAVVVTLLLGGILGRQLAQLQRLNRLAPVAVSVRSGPPSGGGKFEARTELLEILQAAAAQVWTLEPHVAPPPLQLF